VNLLGFLRISPRPPAWRWVLRRYLINATHFHVVPFPVDAKQVSPGLFYLARD
jgi:hypothetical protein